MGGSYFCISIKSIMGVCLDLFTHKIKGCLNSQQLTKETYPQVIEYDFIELLKKE
jgi:hypothetical protein